MTPHINDDDVYWREYLKYSGVKMKIKHHTDNSPDLNVLDLGVLPINKILSETM